MATKMLKIHKNFTDPTPVTLYPLHATRYFLVTPEPRSALSKRQRLSF
jgi:hypothetical protein